MQAGIDHVEMAAKPEPMSDDEEERQLLLQLQEVDLQLNAASVPSQVTKQHVFLADTVPASEEELRQAGVKERTVIDLDDDAEVPGDGKGAAKPKERAIATPVRTEQARQVSEPRETQLANKEPQETQPAVAEPEPKLAQPAVAEPKPASVEQQATSLESSSSKPEAPKADSTQPAEQTGALVPTGPKPPGMTERQVRLRAAAKMRISRMCKPKSKRTDLNVDAWVRKEWQTGNKNMLADLLTKANFCKEEWLNQLTIIVKKKQEIQLFIDEGWYSEEDLVELGWNKARIDGAKKRCAALGEAYCRNNMYDGIPEFWVVVKETGKRTETQSYERSHTKQSKADGEPEWNHAGQFKGMEGFEERSKRALEVKPEDLGQDKFAQTKAALQKFMESIMSKSGKLRSLAKDLQKNYSDDETTKSCIKTLQDQIQSMDKEYDKCNMIWAQGEVDKFGEAFYKSAEQGMRESTLVCSKAVAAEMKVRNAKKFFEKSTAPDKKPRGAKTPKSQDEEGKKDKKDKKDKSKHKRESSPKELVPKSQKAKKAKKEK